MIFMFANLFSAIQCLPHVCVYVCKPHLLLCCQHGRTGQRYYGALCVDESKGKVFWGQEPPSGKSTTTEYNVMQLVSRTMHQPDYWSTENRCIFPHDLSTYVHVIDWVRNSFSLYKFNIRFAKPNFCLMIMTMYANKCINRILLNPGHTVFNHARHCCSITIIILLKLFIIAK